MTHKSSLARRNNETHDTYAKRVAVERRLLQQYQSAFALLNTAK